MSLGTISSLYFLEYLGGNSFLCIFENYRETVAAYQEGFISSFVKKDGDDNNSRSF